MLIGTDGKVVKHCPKVSVKGHVDAVVNEVKNLVQEVVDAACVPSCPFNCPDFPNAECDAEEGICVGTNSGPG